MGATQSASSGAAQQGLRPCKPPSKRRLGTEKLIAEPLPEVAAGVTPIDRAGSLGMLCGQMRCHEISHSSRYFIDHLLR